jgi:hypothetical protein
MGDDCPRRPGPPLNPPHIRASDEERELAARRLQQAAGEGRLSAQELEDRVGAAYGARTRGELEQLFVDLPRPATGGRSQPPAMPRWRRLALAAVAVPLAFTLAHIGGVLVGHAHWAWAAHQAFWHWPHAHRLR